MSTDGRKEFVGTSVDANLLCSLCRWLVCFGEIVVATVDHLDRVFVRILSIFWNLRILQLEVYSTVPF